MKKITFFAVLFIFSQLVYSYTPLYDFSALVGYAPSQDGFVVKMMMKLPKIEKFNFPFLIYCSGCVSKKGETKGIDVTEVMDEPFEWWKEDGDKKTSITAISVGIAKFLDKNPRLGAACYIGTSIEDSFTQYKSSATGMYFYKHHNKKVLFEVGADLIYRYKALVLSTGLSIRTNFNFAVGIRF